MYVPTEPGVPVVGSTCAGQVMVTFATEVVAVGGNKYVIFALNTEPDGAAGKVP